MAGLLYQDLMDQMFAPVNPGFASRFNRRRVHFLPWTAQLPTDAVVEEIKRADRSMTEEAISHLRACCIDMQPLPSWGSACDVFETILPALCSQRAKRLVAASKVLAAAGIETDTGAKTSANKASARKTAQAGLVQPPYELEDVQLPLRPIVVNRMQALGYEDYAPPEPQHGIRSMGDDEGGGVGACEPPKAPKLKHKSKIRNDQDEDEDGSDDDIRAALEQACVGLGYSEEDIVEMLKPCGDYTQELLARVV
jgi:hypothetical protein